MNEEIGGGGGGDSWCVCSGLIMGSVQHIQHKTEALISGVSHSFLLYVTARACTATGLLIG